MSVWNVAVSAYRSVLPTVGVSAVGGLIAGSILAGMEAELAAVPGLLVVVPAFLAIRGSVYGSLGSRLSTALHQGLIQPTLGDDTGGRVRAAVAAALLVGTTASLFAATLTVVVLSVLGRAVAPLSVLGPVAVLAALLAGSVLSTVVVLVVFVGFQRGVDPDDLVGPAVTTAGDLFGLLSLIVAVRAVLWLTGSLS
mgnify:CR=1 FL=1